MGSLHHVFKLKQAMKDTTRYNKQIMKLRIMEPTYSHLPQAVNTTNVHSFSSQGTGVKEHKKDHRHNANRTSTM
ncbi:hypothetical protein VNO77_27377 [Canavalia gladiata]|uniref:Uncharacterized protein n=1 Tax=Canavalia gladiata TaxID=3824 RepID=A0AAN9KX55_CANGL